MAFVWDLHALEGQRNEAPGFVEIFFELSKRRQHARVSVGHVDDGAPVKIRRPQVELMSRQLALLALETRGQLLILPRHLGPFGMPAFEVEEFYPPRDAADVGIGVIRGNLHADFQLPAAG